MSSARSGICGVFCSCAWAVAQRASKRKRDVPAKRDCVIVGDSDLTRCQDKWQPCSLRALVRHAEPPQGLGSRMPPPPDPPVQSIERSEQIDTGVVPEPPTVG